MKGGHFTEPRKNFKKMPLITFRKHYPPLEVPRGANLRQSLLDHGVPVASSCGGVGVCGKCSVQILEGEANLSPMTEEERNLQQNNQLARHRRISCLLAVYGDILIDNSYW
jgi:2Fe-2S ferredoxin